MVELSACLDSCVRHAGDFSADVHKVDSGAIVVPAEFSERVCIHLGGVEGWLEKWNVTEYEADLNLCPDTFTETPHAVHLLGPGARLLNALTAEMPHAENYYDLAETLSRDRDISQYFERYGNTSVDGKVLQNLRRVCVDIRQHGTGHALWVRGLSLKSPLCHRSWNASLYEGWHACKTALPVPRFTFIELFAGIGGFRLGLEALGGRSVFACELNPHARATYQRNFAEMGGAAKPLIDVRRVESAQIPAFGILTAGFPCQPYTEYNPRREGLDSQKGQLVHEVIRILRETQPAAALLENVLGLLTIHGGADFKKIVVALRESGYAVGWQVLSAEHFVPQKRLRVYIVCIRRDLHTSEPIAETEVFRSMPSKDGEFGGERVIKWLEVAPGHTFAKTVGDILETSMTACETESFTLREAQWAKVSAFEGNKLDLIEKRLVQLDGPARTLRSSYKSDFKTISQFVPQPASRPRFFTSRECARLMGFPDSFQAGEGVVGFPRSFTIGIEEGNFYHQLGNAVVPAVIEAIGARMLDALRL